MTSSMTGTFWFAGLLLGVIVMAAVLYLLRGALHRFVDDGGLYSTYNGERPYSIGNMPSVKHVAKRGKLSRLPVVRKA